MTANNQQPTAGCSDGLASAAVSRVHAALLPYAIGHLAIGYRLFSVPWVAFVPACIFVLPPSLGIRISRVAYLAYFAVKPPLKTKANQAQSNLIKVNQGKSRLKKHFDRSRHFLPISGRPSHCPNSLVTLQRSIGCSQSQSKSVKVNQSENGFLEASRNLSPQPKTPDLAGAVASAPASWSTPALRRFSRDGQNVVFGKLRRSEILVENQPPQNSKLRRSGISHRCEYAAPAKLNDLLPALAANMPLLRNCETARFAHLSRRDNLKIAGRFNAGFEPTNHSSPEETAEFKKFKVI